MSLNGHELMIESSSHTHCIIRDVQFSSIYSGQGGHINPWITVNVNIGEVWKTTCTPRQSSWSIGIYPISGSGKPLMLDLMTDEWSMHSEEIVSTLIFQRTDSSGQMERHYLIFREQASFFHTIHLYADIKTYVYGGRGAD